MEEGLYGLVVTIPYLLIVVVLCIVQIYMVMVLRRKWKDSFRLIATYVFPNIVDKMAENDGPTRSLLTDGRSKLSLQVHIGFSLVFICLLSTIVMMFFQLLLLDISYSCDLDDNNKDCFEYKLWDTSKFSKEPIDCSSAAVQTGTVDVICYKFVFNAGLAMGASYGTFKISMAVINLLATGILMIKETQTICKIRMILAFLYVGSVVGLVVIQFTTLRVFLVSSNLVTILQAVAVLVVGIGFVIVIPWKDLIRLKNEQSNQQDRGVENMAQV